MSAPPPIRELPDLAATKHLAHAIGQALRPGDAVLLQGELGAGKTTLARMLLRFLANDDSLDVPSPTYTLVQEYETRLGRVHHFDLWRLSGPDSLPELGWDEARQGIVLVEWPDRLGPARPPNALTVSLQMAGDGRRAHLTGWPGRDLP